MVYSSSGTGCNNFCIWDGSCPYGNCNDGVYYYIANFSNLCQSTVSINSSVTLFGPFLKSVPDTLSLINDEYNNGLNQYLSNTKNDSLKEIPTLLISITPNPNNGIMQLNYELQGAEKGKFEIYDMLGKLLYSYDLISGENTLSIGRSELSQGIYIYKAYANNNLVASDKIVVIKK